MAHRLGIDVGNTFTDLLLLDDSGAAHALKTPNRPDDPVAAVAGGIRRLADEAGVAPGDIGTVVHGAPGLNPAAADGPGVGLLVTAGFEHVLLLARGQGASPLAGRVVATLGIAERMNAEGQVQQPLDEARARAAIQTLRDLGATTIAISLLHAAANPAHEKAVRALVRDIAGDMPVTLSSDVVKEAADYERTVAAVSAAVLRPALTGYFDNLEGTLRPLELAADIRVARADGGFHVGRPCRRRAGRCAEPPAPAAGVAAAAAAASRAGYRDALALDMGGGAAVRRDRPGRCAGRDPQDPGGRGEPHPALHRHRAGRGRRRRGGADDRPRRVARGTGKRARRTGLFRRGSTDPDRCQSGTRPDPGRGRRRPCA